MSHWYRTLHHYSSPVCRQHNFPRRYRSLCRCSTDHHYRMCPLMRTYSLTDSRTSWCRWPPRHRTLRPDQRFRLRMCRLGAHRCRNFHCKPLLRCRDHQLRNSHLLGHRIHCHYRRGRHSDSWRCSRC